MFLDEQLHVQRHFHVVVLPVVARVTMIPEVLIHCQLIGERKTYDNHPPKYILGVQDLEIAA